MGTASFVRKMDVRLPGDINLKTGIFLAVDGQLIAVFAVKPNRRDVAENQERNDRAGGEHFAPGKRGNHQQTREKPDAGDAGF